MKNIFWLLAITICLFSCQEDEETTPTNSNNSGNTGNTGTSANQSYINFTYLGVNYTFTTADPNFQAGLSSSFESDFCKSYGASVFANNNTGLQPRLVKRNNCSSTGVFNDIWFSSLFETGQFEFVNNDTDSGWEFTIYNTEDMSTVTTYTVPQPASSQITITNVQQETNALGTEYVVVTGTFQCDLETGPGGEVSNGTFRLRYENL